MLERDSIRASLIFRGPAVALATFCLVVVGAAAAPAQSWDPDLRIGVYTDAGEGFVGAGFLTRLGDGAWFLNPNLEYVFVDRGDLWTLNADFHYDLASDGEFDLWLGGGPALVFREDRRGRDETDLGVNLLAGISFLRGQPFRPYLQGKLLLSDDSEAVFAFGVRF